VVTLVAVAFGSEAAQKDIGVGAALGGPLVLSTVAYGIAGIALLAMRRRQGLSWRISVNGRRLKRDQAAFLLIFVCSFALGLVAFTFKPWFGIAFLGAYAVYFILEMRTQGVASPEPLQPLKIRPRHPSPALDSGANPVRPGGDFRLVAVIR
jgi:cation:H+ antiporter